MTPVIFPSKSLHWQVKDPEVVIAFGLLQESLIKRYTSLAEGHLLKQLRDINERINIKIIPKATGAQTVEALMNPSTVGFIFISHSYKTQNTLSTVMVGADGQELPHNILSAATPALRFVSFLGCHGPAIRKQYEIDFQAQMSSGFNIFYQSEDRYLSTNLSLIDNVKRLLKKEVKDLKKRLSPTQLIRGIVPVPPETPPELGGDGTLTIQVKDVFPRMEPRYIQVNQQIIGVLGGDEAHSNTVWDENSQTFELDKNFKELTYRVPSYVFQDFDFTDQGQVIREVPLHHDVRILPAEMTPGRPVDNYIIRSVSLTGPFGTREKNYAAPPSSDSTQGERIGKHIGDQSAPPIESQPPERPIFRGSKKNKRRQLETYVLEYIKFIGWIDKDPKLWESAPLETPIQSSRFYKDIF